MSLNTRVAEHLEELAQLMQLLDVDTFRVNAHARAARLIADLSTDLQPLTGDKKALIAIDGIGSKIADKIIEFAASGTTSEYKELAAQVPAGLLPLLKISGFGPKTVRMLWQDGGAIDEAGVRALMDSGKILELPRMGEKAVQKLKAALEFARASNQRVRAGQAMPVAQLIVSRMLAVAGVDRCQFAGSLRRGRDTVGDLDILVTMKDSSPAAAAGVTEAFRTMPEVQHVLASGDTRSSVQFALKMDGARWGDDAKPLGPAIQVDLKIVPAGSLGAALLYFTGSKDHNVRMRERALSRGLTLNEYGLFPNDADPTPPHKRGIVPLAAATEEDIFKALELPFIPPEIREDRSELELVSTPRLVEVADIKAELHSHTKASDGVMTILEAAAKAKSRGFHTLAITDHSQSSPLAGGLKPDRLREHIAAIRAAQKQVEGITLLAGSEVDILADGTLDYDDELLAELDVVVASPHAALTQDPATATARLLKAIQHPMVHIIGHPTGRLIARRQGLEPDMGTLIAAAKKHDVALEINSHWMRLDLRDTHAAAAIHAGCKLAIDCDVHHPDDYENLAYGVMTARRAWATPESVINTWDAKKLHGWLKGKRVQH